MRRATVAVTLLAFAGWRGGSAQAVGRLTLADALTRAQASHPGLIQPRADREAAASMVLATRAAYFPKVSAEWSVVRSDDPVAVFGSKLRQGVFAGPDLALAALNHPNPVTNAAIGLTVEQPLVAPEGWSGRRAALAAADAARLGEARAEQFVAFEVVQNYLGARLAEERIGVLDDALQAARETLHQVLTLRREGVVTVVDEQLVRARVSELEAASAAAKSQAAAAIDQLLIAIGERPGQPVELADGFEARGPSGAAAEAERPDLAALAQGVRAAEAGVDRARSQYLPTVGAFGTIGTNQGRLGALSGPSHWTAGVMVRWTPFRGFADRAEVLRARAVRDASKSRLEVERRRVVAEERAALADSGAAGAAVAAADLALGSAGQASRVAATRYGAGLATIAELLAVRAAESSQRLMRLDALFRLRLSEARVALARGVAPR